MTAVEAICFDLDETLCTYRRSSAELLALAFERVGVEPSFSVEAYHERIDAYMDAAETKAERRARCFADLAARNGHDRSAGRAVAEAYAALRDHGDVRPLTGVPEVLDALASDYRLALVTNGEPAMQDPKLDALDLVDAFETVVYAGVETPAKPAPEPFERALEALDVTPDRAAHVGDSLESDVAGAHEAGLRSVWIPFRDGVVRPSPTPDYRVDDLAGLVPPPWSGSEATGP